MRAKEYAEKLLATEDLLEIDKIACNVLFEMIKEVSEITKTRNVSTDAGLKSIILEQKNKWEAFCRIVNKSKCKVVLREEGFKECMIGLMPISKRAFEKEVK